MRQLLAEGCRYALGWGSGYDANRLKCQILVRCPCRIEMDTWNEDSFFLFLVEGGEAGLFP
jgi:hypothetical protein